VNEEFFGVYRILEKGKEDSEFIERHFRNLP
jgi:hypothetical protein